MFAFGLGNEGNCPPWPASPWLPQFRLRGRRRERLLPASTSVTSILSLSSSPRLAQKNRRRFIIINNNAIIKLLIADFSLLSRYLASNVVGKESEVVVPH